MFDINTPPVVEPSETIGFNSHPDDALRDHVEKHVLNPDRNDRNYSDEHWGQLREIDHGTIVKGRNGDEDAIQKLMRIYEDILRKELLSCCGRGVFHRHVLAYREEFDGSRRDPELIIKCWSTDKKIFIVARAYVKNGQLLPYSISTGYRDSPYLPADAWVRKGLEREKRRGRYYNGKCEKIIANHWTGNAPYDGKND